MQVWSAPGTTKPTFEEATFSLQGSDLKPYRPGDKLGPSWTNHWVKVDIIIPQELQGSDEPVICKSVKVSSDRRLTMQSNLILVVKPSYILWQVTQFTVSGSGGVCTLADPQLYREVQIQRKMGV